LRSAEYEVVHFLSGLSVVAEGLRKQPALFILDVMLPGIDGFDLCRQIRQAMSLATVPVIFLTAKVSEADRIRGFELGGDDYITKPFSPRELLARIRTLLRKPPQVPQSPVLKIGTSKSILLQ
jgi:DNA-binding response OmpR family regulator